MTRCLGNFTCGKVNLKKKRKITVPFRFNTNKNVENKNKTGSTSLK